MSSLPKILSKSIPVSLLPSSFDILSLCGLFPRPFSDDDDVERSLMFCFDDVRSSEDLLLISAINASAFALMLLVELPGIKS